jgi:hypothetical protein
MTEQEILEKVLAKAIKNGYSALHIKEFGIDNMAKMMMGDGYSLAGLLFSHPFAKAFWGTKSFYDGRRDIDQEMWEYHLEIMVLEENPLKYMEQFI